MNHNSLKTNTIKKNRNQRIAAAWFEALTLPVAPSCNLMCNFCTKICDCICNGNSPECLSKAMTPRQAANFALEQTQKNSRIKVIKISGPGEPLYNKATFEVLRRLNENLPHYEFVINTNGLLLYESVEKLVSNRVKKVNVAFNAIYVETMKRLVSRIVYEDQVISDPAHILDKMLQGQLEGIKSCRENGIEVSVNTIFFPGINDADVMTIASLCRKLGVEDMNFISCYPNGKLKNLKVPSLYDMADMKEEMGQSVQIKIETFSPSGS